MNHTEAPLCGHVTSLRVRVGQTLGVPIPVPESPWTLNTYCDLVDRLTATGRSLGWFSENVDGERLLLRHDVDLDLDIALDHARSSGWPSCGCLVVLARATVGRGAFRDLGF